MCNIGTNKEANDLMIRFTASAALAGLIALSAAGCAVEVPMKAFRMAPPDATLNGGCPASGHEAPHRPLGR